MNLNHHKFMDADTLQVLAAAFTGLGATLVVIDWILKTAIAVTTLWYLVLKIRRLKNNPKPNKEQEDEYPVE